MYTVNITPCNAIVNQINPNFISSSLEKSGIAGTESEKEKEESEKEKEEKKDAAEKEKDAAKKDEEMEVR